jgi:hypothetical protein
MFTTNFFSSFRVFEVIGGVLVVYFWNKLKYYGTPPVIVDVEGSAAESDLVEGGMEA